MPVPASRRGRRSHHSKNAPPFPQPSASGSLAEDPERTRGVGGSIFTAKRPTHNKLLPRLRRIEGQVRGITRMVDERRYCIDIVQQLTAARRALDQVSLQVMSGHINTCVSEAIRRREGEGKINELMQTITRFVK